MAKLAVLLGMAAVAGGVALTRWWNSPDQKARRAARSARRVAIVDAVDGERVRVEGRVEVDRPAIAPLTGRVCAVWRVVIRQLEGQGRNKRWVTIHDEQGGADFRLRDDQGHRALVRTNDMDLVLTGGAEVLHPRTDDVVQRWLDERRIFEGDGGLELSETALPPDRRVCVAGLARVEVDPDAAPTADGYRENAPATRLVLVAPDAHPLVITDGL